jgi:hypothetical protein
MLAPALPAQQIPNYASFANVEADVARHRVFAADQGSQSLIVVNSSDGTVQKSIFVGHIRNLKVDGETGHVFTVNGQTNEIAEYDPDTEQRLHEVQMDGRIDFVAYDETRHVLYAETDGSLMRLNTKSFEKLSAIPLSMPVQDEIVLNSINHKLYFNSQGNLMELDPESAKVHPIQRIDANSTAGRELQLDAQRGTAYEIAVNGDAETIDITSGIISHFRVATGIEQCASDFDYLVMACATETEVYLLNVAPTGHLVVLGGKSLGKHSLPVVAIDGLSKTLWAFYSSPRGDFVQALKASSNIP